MIRYVLILIFVFHATSAFAQMVKIVGIGAASCVHFNEEIARDPRSERDYFAWAQGFMSGVLAQAPQGVDEGLDLTPPSVSLQKQAAFLREFCSSNQSQNYAEGVLAIYNLLRRHGKGT